MQDGTVRSLGWPAVDLGPLAGARAEMTDPSSIHRVAAGATAAALTVPAAGLLALTRKQVAVVMVVFPDGTVHQRKLNGGSAVRRAQAEVIQFNALAQAVAASTVPPGQGTGAEDVEEDVTGILP
jgi:hypothetical protein